jgi:hypothetical protein
LTITSEKQFKKDVVDVLEYRGFHVQRHEDKYETGIPDLSYGRDGINGWIEVKWERLKFEPKQPLWLSKRAMTGGHVFVLQGLPGGARLIDWGTLELWEFKGPVIGWSWDLIYQLLRGPDLYRANLLHRTLPSGFQEKLPEYLSPGSPATE